MLAAAAVLAACGYAFSASPGIVNLTAGEAVRVETFQNASLEADAGIIARRAAARAVAERGATVQERRGTLVLTGTVESVIAAPGGAGSWTVTARLRLALIDPDHEGRTIAHSLVTGAETYLSGDDVEASEVSRRLATNRLLERIAGMAVDSLAR